MTPVRLAELLLLGALCWAVLVFMLAGYPMRAALMLIVAAAWALVIASHGPRD